MLSFSMRRCRRWLLLMLAFVPALAAFNVAAHQTPLPADAPAAPLDGAALGGGGALAAGEAGWALSAVEPDAMALVQQPLVLAMDLASAGRGGADAAPPPNRVLPAPAPSHNWARWVQIAAPPVVLVIGASLLVWFARSSGRRHRRHTRSRGSAGYRM